MLVEDDQNGEENKRVKGNLPSGSPTASPRPRSFRPLWSQPRWKLCASDAFDRSRAGSGPSFPTFGWVAAGGKTGGKSMGESQGSSGAPPPPAEPDHKAVLPDGAVGKTTPRPA